MTKRYQMSSIRQAQDKNIKCPISNKIGNWIFEIGNYLKFNCGFTLIELMVVISVMGILTGIGFVSFVNNSRREAVEQAASEIKSVIEQAKFNALSRVKPSSNVCLNYPLRGYLVNIAPSSATNFRYQFLIMCVNGSGGVLSEKLIVDRNINIEIVDCQSIEFRILTNNVLCNNAPIPSGTTRRLRVSGYGITRNVNIDSSGNITITN